MKKIMMGSKSSTRLMTGITALTNRSLLFLLLFFSSTSYAQVQDAALTQRNAYLAAEKALQNNQMNEYNRLKLNLTNTHYILAPYLEYAEIQRLMGKGLFPEDKVSTFLNAEEGNALASRLRSSWLTYLGKHKKWDLYQKHYRQTNDVALQCYDIYSRYLLKNDAKILDESKTIWLSGKSQPAACDVTFAAWKSKGGLTEELVWQRIYLAMEANQYLVVNHLKKLLPEKKQPLVQAWLNTYRDPKIITSTKLFSANEPFLRDTQIYGLRRLARKDPDQAIKTWHILEKNFSFTDAQRFMAFRSIAVNKAMRHQQDALQWFNKIPQAYYDTPTYEWYVRNAILIGQWEEAAHMINRFPAQLREDNTWDYWLARAYERTGKTDAAKQLYTKLSKERSFYGFVASDRINAPYPLSLPRFRLNEDIILETMQVPGIARALELQALGKILAARREWTDTVGKLDESHLQAAALIAAKNQWPERAILTLTAAQNQNDLDMRVPLLYRKKIEQEAKKQGLNPAWVYAIARRESAFLADARSPVGATGLMQLMPYTAKTVAGKLKEPYRSPSDLIQPDLNIRLGSAYLNEVYRSMNRNIILATASYNAGPSRVKSWLPKHGKIAADIWIENIPFTETREYVKAVLIYRMIYQDHLNMKGRLDEVMGDV